MLVRQKAGVSFDVELASALPWWNEGRLGGRALVSYSFAVACAFSAIDLHICILWAFNVQLIYFHLTAMFVVHLR